MRVITLNVNGIRSAANKGLFRWLAAQRAEHRHPVEIGRRPGAGQLREGRAAPAGGAGGDLPFELCGQPRTRPPRKCISFVKAHVAYRFGGV